MFRRLLSVLLAVALVAAVGCGDSDKNTAPPKGDNTPPKGLTPGGGNNKGGGNTLTPPPPPPPPPPR